MKVFLPFAVKEIGGTSTFARKFKAGMEAAGHEVTYDYTPDYDVLFLIVQCPLKYLLDAKKRGKKIVQRLDGTYYWSVSGWKFPLMNAKAAYIRHLFTDFTIYQSEYSKESANRFLGKKRNDRHAIIYNGVDLAIFSPRGPQAPVRDHPKQQIFFTASAFRRRDQIVPLIRALDVYAQKYTKDFKCLIGGNFIGEVADMPEKLKRLPYVELLGKVNNADLPSYERAADVFLFTHLNPPCPNNIIESLACGLPICGVADGAMPELVESSVTGELLPVTGTGYWRHRSFAAEVFADNLQAVIKNQKYYSQQAATVAQEQFSLQAMCRRYVQAFELLVE